MKSQTVTTSNRPLPDRKRPDINFFTGLPDFAEPEPGNKKRKFETAGNQNAHL